MPILAYVYVLYLCWYIIDSVRVHVKRGDPAWYMALDFMSGFIMVAAFVGYWVRDIVDFAPRVAPYIFAASWAWAFCWAPYEIKRSIANMQSDEERRLYVRFGFWLETVLAIPAFWFGGKAVLRVL